MKNNELKKKWQQINKYNWALYGILIRKLKFIFCTLNVHLTGFTLDNRQPENPI